MAFAVETPARDDLSFRTNDDKLVGARWLKSDGITAVVITTAVMALRFDPPPPCPLVVGSPDEATLPSTSTVTATDPGEWMVNPTVEIQVDVGGTGFTEDTVIVWRRTGAAAWTEATDTGYWQPILLETTQFRPWPIGTYEIAVRNPGEAVSNAVPFVVTIDMHSIHSITPGDPNGWIDASALASGVVLVTVPHTIWAQHQGRAGTWDLVADGEGIHRCLVRGRFLAEEGIS